MGGTPAAPQPRLAALAQIIEGRAYAAGAEIGVASRVGWEH